jgi:ABC-type nickel/cobalt efflux system permease component RcnA
MCPYRSWEKLVTICSYLSTQWQSNARTFVSGHYALFYFYAPRRNNFFWSRILKLFHRNDHHIEMNVSHTTFGSLPWKSRSQHGLAAKSCPAHNFFIWSPILKLFHTNDHHIETTCHTQHFGRYLEGQGQSMTLQQNRVRPITLLYIVGFKIVWF